MPGPYGGPYASTQTAPPPPPRRRRRTGLFVALGVFAAFAIGVAGAGRTVRGSASCGLDCLCTAHHGSTTPSVSTVPNAHAVTALTEFRDRHHVGGGNHRPGPSVDIVSTFEYQKATGAGTGIVLTATGEILTNNHVISGATSISVTDVGNGQTVHSDGLSATTPPMTSQCCSCRARRVFRPASISVGNGHGR